MRMVLGRRILDDPFTSAMATVTGSVVVRALVVLMLSGVAMEAQPSPGRPIEYSLKEELPVGSFVGNVKQKSNLTSRYSGDDLARLRFHFRHSTHSHQFFNIDERQGVLTTAQVVDRETLCPLSALCDLSLDIAVRPVQFFQIIKVIIHVVDVNDNSPAFPQDRMTISITETTLPGALLLIPAAEDADSGILGVQEYQLVSDYDEFQLVVTDQVDGSKDLRLKLVDRLDRELEDRYTMTVLALDGGRPQRTGSVDVEVVVLDANDNSPRFENASYEVEVPENVPASSTLLRVEARDPDDGPNGIVVFAFADSTERAHGEQFGIDVTTGDVFLKAGLDYEKAQTFQLTVRATDLGSGSLPVFAKVTINVLDLNDNAPQIAVNVLTDSDFAHVRENTDPGTFVAHAAVKDLDSGANSEVDCSIDNRSFFHLEALYASEYKIVTTVTFDREERSYYDVTLTCRDKGDPAMTSSRKIDVLIIDENDNSPRLSRDLYELSMDENNAPSSVVALINATDADDGKNSALLYRILPLRGTPENALAIDPVFGKVTARIVFDYEKRSQYEFLVVVADRGDPPLSATATLLLTIADTNDEWPRFDRSIYYLGSRENQPTGTVIGSVNATDLDATEDFRRVVYRFIEPNAIFDIDATSGQIRNMKRLDREEQDVYTFAVVAHNDVTGGNDGIETRVNVTVYVDDENDNAPVFQFPPGKDAVSSRVDIAGNSGAGTLITRLVATDSDDGENARLSYSIGSGNADGLFDIDPVTGVIVLARDLPKSSTNQLHKLVVIVRDAGTPQLMSVGDLHVLANNSLGPSMSGQQADLSALLFEGGNLVIFVGAALGLIVVLTCVVIGVVCVRRRRRRRDPRDEKFAAVASCGAHLLQQQHQQPQALKCRSSSPSCSTKVSRGCGSLASTMDSNSVRSGGSHRHSCDCRVDGLTEEETTYIDRIPIDWAQQDSGIVTVSSPIVM